MSDSSNLQTDLDIQFENFNNEYFVRPNKYASVSGVDALNVSNFPIQISDISKEIISEAISDSDSSPVVITTDSLDLRQDIPATSDVQTQDQIPVEEVEEIQ